MRLMSTSSLGCARRSFISGNRLWPPAMTLASGSSSSPTASCRLPAARYSNLAGNMPRLLVDARVGGLGIGRFGLLEWLLAAQLLACRERRLDDVLVARATAQ